MKRKIKAKLLKWKEKSKDRKPLVLNGARQVGKTYILKEFGREYFKNTVYVNLEIDRQVGPILRKIWSRSGCSVFWRRRPGRRLIRGNANYSGRDSEL